MSMPLQNKFFWRTFAYFCCALFVLIHFSACKRNIDVQPKVSVASASLTNIKKAIENLPEKAKVSLYDI